MATAAQLLTAMATVITTNVSGAVRLGSDYRVDLEAIPLGATRYQLSLGPAGEAKDSNSSRIILSGSVSVYHRLADPDAERTYTEGAMQTTLDALLQTTTWTALAECFQVASDPAYSVERVVNVIATEIQLALSVA
jgi:hypothetical protein